MPLDRVLAILEELTAQEERATWRAYISGREVKLEDVMKLSVPSWAASEQESSAAPYPVTPAVARGLDQALALGLLNDALWTENPVNTQFETLSQVWERIVARL